MSLTPEEKTEMLSLESQISGYMSREWLTSDQRARYDSIRRRLDDLHRRDSEAPPPASPPTPPPASPPTGTVPVSQAPPVHGQTKYLPLTGNEGYDYTIRKVDAALDRINNTTFALNPDDLWYHDGARLGGPSGPPTISALKPVTTGVGDLTSDTAGKFHAISGMWDKYGNQNTISRIKELHAPLMRAAMEGVGEGGPASVAGNAIDQSGNGIRGVFESFHGAIRSSRDAIDGLYGTDAHGNRYLDTTRSLNLNPSIVSDAQSKLHGLQDSTRRLGSSLDNWNIPTRITADSAPVPPGGESPAAPPAPVPPGGESPAAPPAPVPPGGESPAAPPAPVSPGGESPPMPPISSMPVNGDTHLSSDNATPENTVHPENSHVKDTPSADTRAAEMAMVPHVGDLVRPGALGADGKPLDKDGDGKMDADAIAATRENMDSDKDGLPNQIRVPLSADGRVVDVTLSDPRVAEMMTRMSGSTETSPLSVLDSAKASGLDLKDYGEKIDTLDLRPGDVVTGTATGMYAGNGLVLTQDGHLKGLEEVMDFSRSNPSVHRLAIPPLPSDSETLPPTSPSHDAPSVPEIASSGQSGLPQEVPFEGHALG